MCKYNYDEVCVFEWSDKGRIHDCLNCPNMPIEYYPDYQKIIKDAEEKTHEI